MKTVSAKRPSATHTMRWARAWRAKLRRTRNHQARHADGTGGAAAVGAAIMVDFSMAALLECGENRRCGCFLHDSQRSNKHPQRRSSPHSKLLQNLPQHLPVAL